MRPKKFPIGLIFLILTIVTVVVIYFIWKQDPATTDTQDDQNQTQQEDNTVETDTQTETETDTTTPDPEEDDTPSSTDFSSFKTSKQSTGTVVSGNNYTLKTITDTKRDGYHEISFTLARQSDTTEVGPNVTAEYKSALGAIRVDLNNTTKDESGIGYQKSRMINEQGVIKIYHNVSSDQTEELYDVGVSSSTPFELSTVGVDAQSWMVILKVKYPGGTSNSGVIGSDTFSKDLQAIDGALTPDSAKITAYSYNTSGGVLTVIFSGSGSTNRPIPSATASYVGGKLTLEFPGLVSDSLYKAMDGKTLSSGISVDSSRSGSKSTYIFNGASKEFKLYGETSPNQVVLEIRL